MGEVPTPLPLPEKTLGEALLEKERERERRERERTPLKLHLEYGSASTAPPGEAILEDRSSVWGQGTPLSASSQSARRPLGLAGGSSEGLSGRGGGVAEEGSLGGWGAAASSGSPSARSLNPSVFITGEGASEAEEGDAGGSRGWPWTGERGASDAVVHQSVGRQWGEGEGAAVAVQQGAEAGDVGAGVEGKRAPVVGGGGGSGGGVGGVESSNVRNERPALANVGKGKGKGVMGDGGGEEAGAPPSWKDQKDEEPVGGCTEEEAVDTRHSDTQLARHSSWGRRLREATTLRVPSEEFGSVASALAAAMSGDIIEVR